MLVTTKGRYALRLILNIVSHGEGQKVALRQIAEDEHISPKYLEQLARVLVEAGLLKSVRGHGGGYALAREASSIKAGDVLRAVEGSTSPVACSGLTNGCPLEKTCSTISFWAGLDQVIEEYVDGATLADLAKAAPGNATCVS